MIEVIERCEGDMSRKKEITGQIQVSYNDWGHLVIRVIQGRRKDVLIVLSQEPSNKVIDFCQNTLKPIRKIPKDDCPF